MSFIPIRLFLARPACGDVSAGAERIPGFPRTNLPSETDGSLQAASTHPDTRRCRLVDIYEPPSKNAIVLFDGTDLSAWHKKGDEPATWVIEDGILSCNATGNIMTTELFEDCYIHVEFFIPAEGPGNSGVYLQGRYEIQVLSHDYRDMPDVKVCGAIYDVHAPLQQVQQARETWQSFDIIFRAPRMADGEKADNARITVLHNGMIIHNNVDIPGPTGGHLDVDEGTPGPLMLQDHGGNPVSFRNVWAVHL
ncbi:MAG: DUF1080 domain-containing protein [candidate division WS1 bacterium]|nr:DUF1080 domain-containing protein [candidate division WS1 bacterium]